MSSWFLVDFPTNHSNGSSRVPAWQPQRGFDPSLELWSKLPDKYDFEDQRTHPEASVSAGWEEVTSGPSNSTLF